MPPRTSGLWSNLIWDWSQISDESMDDTNKSDVLSQLNFVDTVMQSISPSTSNVKRFTSLFVDRPDKHLLKYEGEDTVNNPNAQESTMLLEFIAAMMTVSGLNVPDSVVTYLFWKKRMDKWCKLSNVKKRIAQTTQIKFAWDPDEFFPDKKFKIKKIRNCLRKTLNLREIYLNNEQTFQSIVRRLDQIAKMRVEESQRNRMAHYMKMYPGDNWPMNLLSNRAVVYKKGVKPQQEPLKKTKSTLTDGSILDKLPQLRPNTEKNYWTIWKKLASEIGKRLEISSILNQVDVKTCLGRDAFLRTIREELMDSIHDSGNGTTSVGSVDISSSTYNFHPEEIETISEDNGIKPIGKVNIPLRANLYTFQKFDVDIGSLLDMYATTQSAIPDRPPH